MIPMPIDKCNFSFAGHIIQINKGPIHRSNYIIKATYFSNVYSCLYLRNFTIYTNFAKFPHDFTTFKISAWPAHKFGK